MTPDKRADLLALAERVESGSGEDRELDALIHVAVLNGGRTGQFKSPTAWAREAIRANWNVARFTSDLAAVVALLERVLPGWSWLARSAAAGETLCFARVESPDFDCVVWTAGGRDSADVMSGADFMSRAPSPARALLAATLRALASQEGQTT